MRKIVISLLRYIIGIALGTAISTLLYYQYTGKMLSQHICIVVITALLLFGCCLHIYYYIHNKSKMKIENDQGTNDQGAV